MCLKYIAMQIQRNFGYFSSRGIVPVTMLLATATLMIQLIIVVQSASVTTENSSVTNETSPKIEKIPENIIIKIFFVIYEICTNRNVIICMVVVLVIVCLAFKLTSIEKFFRKKLQKHFSENGTLPNNSNRDFGGSELLIKETMLIVNNVTEDSDVTTDGTSKKQRIRYRSVPKRVN